MPRSHTSSIKNTPTDNRPADTGAEGDSGEISGLRHIVKSRTQSSVKPIAHRDESLLAEKAATYLQLSYVREFLPNPDGTWFGHVRGFGGCTVEGALDDVGARLERRMKEWIQDRLRDGYPIPAPSASADYSGKFFVRIASTLHGELVACARQEGVSLNQFIAGILSRLVNPGYRVVVAISGDAHDRVVPRTGHPERTVVVDGSTARVLVRPAEATDAAAFGPRSLNANGAHSNGNGAHADEGGRKKADRERETFFLDPVARRGGYASGMIELDRLSNVARLRAGSDRSKPRVAERESDGIFSGKFVVRVSRSLHRELAEYADREEMSLNQVVGTALAKAVAPGNRAVIRTDGQTVVVDGRTGRVLIGPSDAVFRDDFTTGWSAVSDDTLVLDPSSQMLGYDSQVVNLEQLRPSRGKPAR